MTHSDELTASASEDGAGEPSRWERWWARNRFRIYFIGLVFVLLVLIFWNRIFIVVKAGHRGVMFRLFSGGTVVDDLWGEGLHVIPPWDELTIYETRFQERYFEFSALTHDGLRLLLKISVRYRPFLSGVGTLHKYVGPDYYERVIQPEIKSALRRTIGDRTAFDVYSTEGDVLQQALKTAEENVEQKPIELDDVIVEEISLPSIVKESIENKHKQEQALLEYQFRLESAEKEADRQRTLATGVRDYHAIMAKQPIPEDILRLRGIEATLELAKSANAKMLVIGGGKDGLPVILDATGVRNFMSDGKGDDNAAAANTDSTSENAANTTGAAP